MCSDHVTFHSLHQKFRSVVSSITHQTVFEKLKSAILKEGKNTLFLLYVSSTYMYPNLCTVFYATLRMERFFIFSKGFIAVFVKTKHFALLSEILVYNSKTFGKALKLSFPLFHSFGIWPWMLRNKDMINSLLTTNHIHTALWKLCFSCLLMVVPIKPLTLLTFNTYNVSKMKSRMLGCSGGGRGVGGSLSFS